MEGTNTSPSSFELPTLQLRLDAARESIKRSRLAYLVTTIASLAVIITLYNTYVSWYRGFALQSSFASNEVTKQAQLFLLEEWVRNQTIAIPPLGIRVGVSDVAFLASASLFICSLWTFFCLRRENHVVGTLLADTEEKSKEVLGLVYHGVSSFMLFLDTTGSDDPIESLQPGEPRRRGLPFVRGSIKFLYFLPGVTVFCCVAFDALTIFYLQAPFRFPHSSLSAHIQASDITWIVIVELFAVILGTLNCVMSARMVAFENATERLLRQYHGHLWETTPKQRHIT